MTPEIKSAQAIARYLGQHGVSREKVLRFNKTPDLAVPDAVSFLPSNSTRQTTATGK